MPSDHNNDAKYVQQHLANERTYLAWIRSSITIIGLGFLASGLIFETTSNHFRYIHLIATVVGIGAVLLGGLIVLLATVGYFQKQKRINEAMFISPSFKIWLLFSAMALINTGLIFLVIYLLLQKK